MIENSVEDYEKSSVADSSTTYPHNNSAKAETVSGSEVDDFGSRNRKAFSVIYSESASEPKLYFAGGNELEFDIGSIFHGGEKEMLRRYLQDTAHYTDASSGLLTSNQEMFEHFLFANASGENSLRSDGDVKDNFEAMDEEVSCFDNYVGHEVGVSREMDLDEDFNSSDSFVSTESIVPKKIICPKCPKRFMLKSDLKRHDKTKHLRLVDSYFCRYCKKAFAIREHLKSHEQVHKKRFKLSGC